jgi:hypothetical protein
MKITILYWLASIGGIFVLFSPFMIWEHLVTSHRNDEDGSSLSGVLGLMWIAYGIGLLLIIAMLLLQLVYRIFPA